MQLDFGLLSLLSAALLFAPAAADVDIIFWTGSSCTYSPSSSQSWSIHNAPANTCWHYTSGGRPAVSFTGLPSGAKGQVYTGQPGCGNYAGEVSGPQSRCFIGSGGGFSSANWFYPSKRLVRKDERLGPTRFSVTYELPDLTTREVEVPAGHVERALKLVEAKDYDALAEFPKFVKG